jgi:putative hydrolase of the HAD superfamily
MYPKSAGVMDMVSQRINAYMALRMGLDDSTIERLRPRYWKQYGTTMRGLYLEFGIDPDDYLSYVHDFSVVGRLAPNEDLRRTLDSLPWSKAVFTNAPAEHAHEVLQVLGVGPCFDHIFDIRTTGYVGKPDPSAYEYVLRKLGAAADECIVLDDSLANLRTASELGMTTVLVGGAEQPHGVDFHIGTIEEVANVAGELRVWQQRQGFE